MSSYMPRMSRLRNGLMRILVSETPCDICVTGCRCLVTWAWRLRFGGNTKVKSIKEQANEWMANMSLAIGRGNRVAVDVGADLLVMVWEGVTPNFHLFVFAFSFFFLPWNPISSPGGGRVPHDLYLLFGCLNVWKWTIEEINDRYLCGRVTAPRAEDGYFCGFCIISLIELVFEIVCL